ncbi:MAG: (2Fe-2S)-binding protein [Deltaproteobacteria bacterium]|nr:MAG: (2Fe-2S)-binding protein [Deltaproteobacteria bacterium]
MTRVIQLTVNGEIYDVSVKPNETLLDVIRDRLGLTGTKKGCDTGQCGSCTVLLEGKPINSCLVLAVEAHGKDILTVEGLAKNGQFHPLQEAFIQEGAVQCGYCTPGMLLSAKALLDENPNPTEEKVKEGIAGNLCRCTGYVKIVKAILTAAERISHD